MRALGLTGGVAVSWAGLASLPGWLLFAAVALAAVLLGLLLFLPADGPICRFERIVAALRGTRHLP
ncbi:MAG TPA: hypothetical protein VLJ59_04345 [Mycobacteriales bacterium]|nr:hypothetical protein [Mycobacteriales bacterium]